MISAMLLASYLPVLMMAGGNEMVASELKPTAPIMDDGVDPFLSGYFIENKGQWEGGPVFSGRTSFGDIHLYESRIVIDVFNMEIEESKDLESPKILSTHVKGCVLVYEFPGSRNILPTGEGDLGSYTNYFMGNDPGRWVTGARNFESVVYRGLWEGIDLRYHFSDNALKYEFVAAPGSEPDDISVRVLGQDSMKVGTDRLQLVLDGNELISDDELVTFLSFEPANVIPSTFVKKDSNTYGFDIGEYDMKEGIVIDPVLYATYVGDQYPQGGNDIAIDEKGNAYVTGKASVYYTQGNDTTSHFPTTAGAYDQTFNGGECDCFVLKLNQDGSNLVFSTFIGGSDVDYGEAIEVDINGDIIISGITGSEDFPSTSGAYDETHNGRYDIFLLRMNDQGNDLVFSTFIGCSSSEWMTSMALDRWSNPYITGYLSFDPDQTDRFPTTHGCFQNEIKGGLDVFVLRLNASGAEVDYATFLGGRRSDYSGGISIDGKGDVFICGTTWSESDFPLTEGGADSSLDGYVDGFVSKFDPALSMLIASTFIGGPSVDEATDIALDDEGNVMITGTTIGDFPVEEGLVDIYDPADGGIFFVKMVPDLSIIAGSGRIGGSENERQPSICIDDEGQIYLSGWSSSADLPTTSNGQFRTFSGENDGFIYILDAEMKRILHGTYFGGRGYEYSHSMVLDEEGAIYITGETTSPDFPVTKGAYDRLFGGEPDVFIMKYGNFSIPEPPTITRGSSGDGFVNISWLPGFNGGMDIKEFRIYRGGSELDMVMVASLDHGIRQLNDTSVFNGHEYLYQVSCVNGMGESPRSNIFRAETGYRPSPPSSIRSGTGDGFVKLSWDEPDETGGWPILGYRLYMETGTSIFVMLEELPADRMYYTHSGLENGITYSYFLRSFNHLGPSDPSEILDVAPMDVPTYPLDLNADAGDRYVNLSWNAPWDNKGSPIEEYRIYRRTGDSEVLMLSSQGPDTLSFNDTGLTNGIRYFYSVSAVNGVGESSVSPEVEAVPMGLPDPPSNLKCTLTGNNAELSWSHPGYDGGSRILKYRIYKGTGLKDLILLEEIVANSDPRFQDLGLTFGDTYAYAVTSKNSAGESEPSNLVKVIPKSIPTPPLDLEGEEGDGYVELSWKAPVDMRGSKLKEYRIYRGVDLEESSLFKTIDAGTLSFNDTDVENGKSYTYYLTAVNFEGESGLSNRIYMDPKGLPTAPVELTVHILDDQVVISWLPPLDDGGRMIVNYRIYKGETIEGLEMVDIVDYNTLNYEDAEVRNNSTYYYAVTAVTGVGMSNLSEIASIFVPPRDEDNEEPPGIEKEDEEGEGLGTVLIIILSSGSVLVLGVIILVGTIMRKGRKEEKRTIWDDPET